MCLKFKSFLFKIELFFLINKKKTMEGCLEMIKTNPTILKYIVDQNKDFYITAIKYNIDSIKYISPQTKDICECAIGTWGGQMIQYINKHEQENEWAEKRNTGI